MKVLSVVRRLGLLVGFLVVFLYISLTTKGFLAIDNILTLIRFSAIEGILAIGLTYVICSGEFDLSFTGTATFVGIVLSLILSAVHNLYISYAAGIAIGLVIGILNSVLVIRIRIPAFIATFGMLTVLDGISDFVTKGQYFVDRAWPKTYTWLGQGLAFQIVPNPVILLCLIALISVILLEYNVYGRRLYAVGGNRKASIYAGIGANKMKASAFIMAGLFYALAGILTCSEMGCAEPQMDGAYQLPAIAAVFLGAVFLKDGMANIWGTILGTIFMVTISIGLQMKGSSNWVITSVQGSIMLVAVGLLAIVKKGAIPSIRIG